MLGAVTARIGECATTKRSAPGNAFRARCMHAVVIRESWLWWRAVCSHTPHRDYRSELALVEAGENMLVPSTVMRTVAVVVWTSPPDPQRTL